jgi:hypothetical protein
MDNVVALPISIAGPDLTVSSASGGHRRLGGRIEVTDSRQHRGRHDRRGLLVRLLLSFVGRCVG